MSVKSRSRHLALTPAYILSIDTSCDDTAAAVTVSNAVHSNIIASQTQLHKEYGGVFPTVAKQAHRENIDAVVGVALKRAGISWSDLRAIAVTQGPGLAPALEVGIAKAKELARTHHLPLIPVNHIEGHLLSALAQPVKRKTQRDATEQSKGSTVELPALALIVSGGHTEFILVNTIGDYQRLGWTVDDAAGEALDKVGRLLGLGYPAGPVMEQFAKLGDPKAFAFPLPMTATQNFNLSFSGLKTNARKQIEELEATGPLSKQVIFDFCASFQNAVFRHIAHKLSKVLEMQEIKEVWLGGGVAANGEIRRMIRETLRRFEKKTGHPKLTFRVPYAKRLCMDNAAMIGLVAIDKWGRDEELRDVTEIEAVERKPRWEVGDTTTV